MVKNQVEEAKSIGSRLGAIFSCIGILLAYAYMSLLTKDILWLVDFEYKFSLIFGAIIFIFNGYVFGKYSGVEIIKNNKSYFGIGLLCAFLTVICSTIIGSLPTFIIEGTQFENYDLDETAFDYIVKPVILVIFFGFIPISIAGSLFGFLIQKQGKKIFK